MISALSNATFEMDWNIEIYNVSLGYNGTWQTHGYNNSKYQATSRFSLVSRIMP